jgi:hypothetical protein
MMGHNQDQELMLWSVAVETIIGDALHHYGKAS